MNYTFNTNGLDPDKNFEVFMKAKLDKLETVLHESEKNAKMDIKLSKIKQIYTINATLIVTSLREGLPEKTYVASLNNEDAYVAGEAIEAKLRRQIKKTLTVVNRVNKKK